MRVRMIFGTTLEVDGKRKDLARDTEQDLDNAKALELIEEGRCEPVDPADLKKLTAKGKADA
jgi:hypothetical protein